MDNRVVYLSEKEKETAKEEFSKPFNKHAYLILAHDNWSLLKKLLRLIDDPRHDIFLHIDAKANPWNVCDIKLRYSDLTIIDSQKVYWADFSQTETELRLLKAAARRKYTYYHLLSGADLPLKTNDERYHFYESSKKNFIGIVPYESYYSIRHVKYYHFLLHNSLYRRCKPLKALDRLLEHMQHLLGVNRLRNNSWRIIDGWTWFSIRHDLCIALINEEESIRKTFQYSIASDELFIQTYVYNMPEFRDTLFDETDLRNGSMRYIDWERGRPYTFGGDETDKDLGLLMNSPYMFARKFSEEKSGALIEQIYKELMEKQKK